jgi:hypothetical protein
MTIADRTTQLRPPNSHDECLNKHNQKSQNNNNRLTLHVHFMILFFFRVNVWRESAHFLGTIDACMHFFQHDHVKFKL